MARTHTHTHTHTHTRTHENSSLFRNIRTHAQILSPYILHTHHAHIQKRTELDRQTDSVRACVSARVHACVRACVRAYGYSCTLMTSTRNTDAKRQCNSSTYAAHTHTHTHISQPKAEIHAHSHARTHARTHAHTQLHTQTNNTRQTPPPHTRTRTHTHTHAHTHTVIAHPQTIHHAARGQYCASPQ